MEQARRRPAQRGTRALLMPNPTPAARPPRPRGVAAFRYRPRTMEAHQSATYRAPVVMGMPLLTTKARRQPRRAEAARPIRKRSGSAMRRQRPAEAPLPMQFVNTTAATRPRRQPKGAMRRASTISRRSVPPTAPPQKFAPPAATPAPHQRIFLAPSFTSARLFLSV